MTSTGDASRLNRRIVSPIPDFSSFGELADWLSEEENLEAFTDDELHRLALKANGVLMAREYESARETLGADFEASSSLTAPLVVGIFLLSSPLFIYLWGCSKR